MVTKKYLFFPVLLILGGAALCKISSLEMKNNQLGEYSSDEYEYEYEYEEIYEEGYEEEAFQYSEAVVEDSENVGDRQPAAAGKGAFSYPITSGKGKRRCRKGRCYTHKGTDYGAPCGTPIYAKAGGVVTKSTPGSGFGNMVAIEVGGCRAIYAHMSSVSVRAGQTVSPGQLIGKVGNTGQSRGCHLHYESCSSLYSKGGGGGRRKGGRRKRKSRVSQ